MIWQLAAFVLCLGAACVWVKRTATATDRMLTEIDQLRLLLKSIDNDALRGELRSAALRFAFDPPTATVLSELADGLLTIDEICDQWEEQKMGGVK